MKKTVAETALEVLAALLAVIIATFITVQWGTSGMMAKHEYEDCINRILMNGMGYDALRDITEILKNSHENNMAVMRELRAEQKAIKKICEGNTSAKEKVQTVLTMM